MRAKHGHPAPVRLKCIEIGNEQRGARYGERGTWSVADGAYRQGADAIGFSYLLGFDSANTTISLKARKISGTEGFLVMGGQVDGQRVQWNVAGWGNTQSAIQAGDAKVGRAVRHRIDTARWYDLRLEVRGRTVRGYVDGVLLNEATYPRIDTVLAIAGGARIAATGQLTTLSSAGPTG